MELALLETTETETPEDRIVCETFSGEMTVLCAQYAGSPVKLQIREPNGTEWQDCSFAGNAIVITGTGQAVEVPITPCFSIRCTTAKAGAKIVAFFD